MPQFFFYVRQAKTVFEDTRGGEFSDVVAAWNWAIDDVRKLVAEGEVRGPLDQHWVEICDSTGAVIASWPFVRVTQLQ